MADDMALRIKTSPDGKLDTLSYSNNKDYTVTYERMGNEDYFTEKDSFNPGRKIKGIELKDVLETAVTLGTNKNRDLFVNGNAVSKEVFFENLSNIFNAETGLDKKDKLVLQIDANLKSMPITERDGKMTTGYKEAYRGTGASDINSITHVRDFGSGKGKFSLLEFVLGKSLTTKLTGDLGYNGDNIFNSADLLSQLSKNYVYDASLNKENFIPLPQLSHPEIDVNLKLGQPGVKHIRMSTGEGARLTREHPFEFKPLTQEEIGNITKRKADELEKSAAAFNTLVPNEEVYQKVLAAAVKSDEKFIFSSIVKTPYPATLKDFQLSAAAAVDYERNPIDVSKISIKSMIANMENRNGVESLIREVFKQNKDKKYVGMDGTSHVFKNPSFETKKTNLVSEFVGALVDGLKNLVSGRGK